MCGIGITLIYYIVNRNVIACSRDVYKSLLLLICPVNDENTLVYISVYCCAPQRKEGVIWIIINGCTFFAILHTENFSLDIAGGLYHYL